MPDWMDPMLATLSHEHFSDPDWLFERKLDGERVIAYRDGDDVRLMSRNRKRINDSYPEVEEAIAEQAPQRCILDGEVVAFDDENVSDFQRLQERMHVSSREEALHSDVRVYYYLFDCMYLDGYDITAVGLRGRKRLLRAAVSWDDPLRWTQHRNEDGEEYLQEACHNGWEGLIAKHAGSEYVHSRSRKWLKFKCVHQQELVIGGYTDPKGERIGFGALLVGFYRDTELVYAGKVGTGFDDDTLRSLHQRLSSMERETSPFDIGDAGGKGVHFVTPTLVCEVAFTEWTEDDKLRHPRYLGLRRDKEPEDVHKEA
ncbi:MAG: non-homologous end-joining DNA ligase [Armatimonadota bacterium]|nr:non-homologous end-joining DNA ligase [Armatimonadota bacterium]